MRRLAIVGMVIGAFGASAFAAQAAPRGTQSSLRAATPGAHKTRLAHAPRPMHEGRSVARFSYAPSARLGYAPLVGDPGSGLGFYALPNGVRAGAARYAARGERNPLSNPVRFAIMADSLRAQPWGPVANTPYRYGVFNPNDGVGTPFFAGWYGPAGGWTSSPYYAGPGLW
ncbi:hypothetical protein [Methylocella sp.]|uniref:hypothetical protein n=1 Tax=Methylocella sp. TaxID=1978226 RepID=UPI003782E16E